MQICQSLITASIGAALTLTLGCGTTDTPTDLGSQTPKGDVSGPVQAEGLRVSYQGSSNSISFAWSAPYDDSAEEKVSRYEIRYAFSRGEAPVDFWLRGALFVNPPDPEDPGNLQSITISDPQRGRNIYVGIMSFDEAENPSAPSELANIWIPGYEMAGLCIDALTGLPVEGLRVTVIAGQSYSLKTNSDGVFKLMNLVPGGMNIEILTADIGPPYHRLSQSMVLAGDIERTFFMIQYQKPESNKLQNTTILQVFKGIELSFGPGSIFATWLVRPVPLYVPPHVSSGGVDYAAQTQAAVDRWESRTGTDLFTVVSSPPTVGITVSYKTRASMGLLLAVTNHTRAPDRHPILDEIDIVNDIADADLVFRIMMHELGHTIQWGHLNWPEFIMYGGQPLPGDISNDEVVLTKLHAALPSRLNMSIYDTSVP
ncbi:MAG: hypothetical protein O7D32_00285 [bacterium]|nr:hypothetical protein [bacterium]